MSWLYVALGGALGSMLRYSLSVFLPFTLGQFPWATWWANIIGCGLAGIFLAALERFSFLQGEARLFLLVGILGGFTTFSSFSLETLILIKNQMYGMAFLYVISSVLIGLISIASTYFIFKLLLS